MSTTRNAGESAPDELRLGAICVLGCPVGTTALKRRADAAARAYAAAAHDELLVVACGGRAWNGRVEADELAELLAQRSVPAGRIVRERCSLDTRDNARFAAALLLRRGLSRVRVVTCVAHLPRAVRLFSAAGLDVDGLAADSTPRHRLYWRVREALASWKDARRPMGIT